MDIDDTCSDTSHRNHLLPPDAHRACVGVEHHAALGEYTREDRLAADLPVLHVRRFVMRCYNEGLPVHFVTGRYEKHRKITTQWLVDHGFMMPGSLVVFRPNEHGHVPAANVKKHGLAALLRVHNARLLVAVDDDAACRKTYAHMMTEGAATVALPCILHPDSLKNDDAHALIVNCAKEQNR